MCEVAGARTRAHTHTYIHTHKAFDKGFNWNDGYHYPEKHYGLFDKADMEALDKWWQVCMRARACVCACLAQPRASIPQQHQTHRL